MNSGVYQLTFSNGSRYIGKSIDIPTRWKQHATAMENDRAAGPIQNAFNLYGYPTTEVLFKCHPDHIDLVEAVFIARNTPELNTTRPPDPFPFVDDMEEVFSLMHESTHQHITTILEQEEKFVKQAAKIKNLEAQIEDLKVTRSVKEVNIEKDRKIRDLREDVANMKLRVIEMQKLLVEKEKPWWKKLF